MCRHGYNGHRTSHIEGSKHVRTATLQGRLPPKFYPKVASNPALCLLPCAGSNWLPFLPRSQKLLCSLKFSFENSIYTSSITYVSRNSKGPATEAYCDKHINDDAVFAVKFSLVVNFLPRKGDFKANFELPYDFKLATFEEARRNGVEETTEESASFGAEMV